MIKKCFYAFIFAFALTLLLCNPKVYAFDFDYSAIDNAYAYFNISPVDFPFIQYHDHGYLSIFGDYTITSNGGTYVILSSPLVYWYGINNVSNSGILTNQPLNFLKSSFINFDFVDGNFTLLKSFDYPRLPQHNYTIEINNAVVDMYVNQQRRFTYYIYDNDEVVGLPDGYHIGWIYNSNLVVTDTDFNSGLWFYAVTPGEYEFTVQLLDEDYNVVASNTKVYNFISRPDFPVIPDNPIQTGFVPNGLPIDITTNIENGNIIVDETINFNEYKYLYMYTISGVDVALFSTQPLFRYQVLNGYYYTGIKDYTFPIKVKSFEFDLDNNYNIRHIYDYTLTTANIVNNNSYGVYSSNGQQFLYSNYNVYKATVDATNFLVNSNVLVYESNLVLDYGTNTGGSDSDNTFDILGNYIKNWFVTMFVPTQQHTQIIEQFTLKIGFLDSFRDLFNTLINISSNSAVEELPSLYIDFSNSSNSLYKSLGNINFLDLSFITPNVSTMIKRFTSVILSITFLFYLGSHIPNILSGVSQGLNINNIRNTH